MRGLILLQGIRFMKVWRERMTPRCPVTICITQCSLSHAYFNLKQNKHITTHSKSHTAQISSSYLSGRHMAKVLKPFMTSQTANVCLIVEKAKHFRWTSSHSHYLSAVFGSLNQTPGWPGFEGFYKFKGQKINFSMGCLFFVFLLLWIAFCFGWASTIVKSTKTTAVACNCSKSIASADWSAFFISFPLDFTALTCYYLLILGSKIPPPFFIFLRGAYLNSPQTHLPCKTAML